MHVERLDSEFPGGVYERHYTLSSPEPLPLLPLSSHPSSASLPPDRRIDPSPPTGISTMADAASSSYVLFNAQRPCSRHPNRRSNPEIVRRRVRITSQSLSHLSNLDSQRSTRLCATSPKWKRTPEAKPFPVPRPVRGRICRWSGEVCDQHGQEVFKSVLE